MMILCLFDSKHNCTLCGYHNKSKERLIRRCDSDPTKHGPAPICIHLGEPVKPIKITCKLCNNKIVQMQTNKCSIHKRCITTYDPHGPYLEEWNSKKPESDIYTLCSQCPDFQTSKKPI
jgi:hypothetical protein